jgi:hypothetical protein
METHTVKVTFEGELLAAYTTEGGTTYRLYRYDGAEEGLFFVYWTDERGSWLETGERGSGLEEWQVRWHWPELAAAAGVKA